MLPAFILLSDESELTIAKSPENGVEITAEEWLVKEVQTTQ